MYSFIAQGFFRSQQSRQSQLATSSATPCALSMPCEQALKRETRQVSSSTITCLQKATFLMHGYDLSEVHDAQVRGCVPSL